MKNQGGYTRSLARRFAFQRAATAILLTILLPFTVGANAQEVEPDRPSIFDFGRFDDPPATQPARPRPSPKALQPKPPAQPTPLPLPEPAPLPPPIPPSVTPAPPSVPPVPPNSPSPPVTPNALQPRPPEVQVAASIAAQRGKFAKEYTAASAGGAPGRAAARALAMKLRASSESAATPVERYALLVEARDQAAAAGDAGLSMNVVDTLLGAFEVDEFIVRGDALVRLAATAVTPHDAHTLAVHSPPLIEAAWINDDFAQAEKIAAAAEQAAVRAAARDAVLLPRVRSYAAEMRWARKQWDAAKSALVAVQSNAGDAAAMSLAGRYGCLVQEDWDKLPLLARGAEEKLKAAATVDLAGATEPNGMLHIAGKWWDATNAEQGQFRTALQSRAAHWYRQAIGAGLTAGAERTQAEQRIEQADTASRRLVPGLVSEVFYDPGLRYRQQVKVDPNVVADFSGSKPDPNLEADVFGIRWSGMLQVPRSGSYTFSVKVKESVRLWIDGFLVMKADHPKNAVTKEVVLSQGLHDIRVHFNSRGSKSNIRLAWTLPGLFDDQPIAAQFFVRDVRAGVQPVAQGGATLVAHGPLDRSRRVGGGGGTWFDELSSDPQGLLVGIRVTSGKWFGHQVTRAVYPIFRTSAGTLEEGPRRGGRGGEDVTVVAKDGYAVGAISASGGAQLNAFKLVFMRVRADGTLDLKDSYESQSLGGTGGQGPHLLGGDGRPVLGICGRCAAVMDSLGIIQRGAPK